MGIVVGKLRTHEDKHVADLAKETVKKWKNDVAAQKEKPAVAAKKEESGSPATADKKVSGAPAPAAAVGGKATAPADEEEAATTAGDFKRFQKAANEADWRKKKAS